MFSISGTCKLICLAFTLMVMGGIRGADIAPAPNAITVDSPQDYQVFQRASRLRGTIRINGRMDIDGGELQFRLSGKSLEGDLLAKWEPVRIDPQSRAFKIEAPVPAGGWYRLELRVLKDGQIVAQATVEHVGVGEVFVVAGQSNATNYGSEKQHPASGMVAAFSGLKWTIADDPQPGTQDSGKGGSFIPAFGDAMFEKYKVPIGVACVGSGATSVRQWLRKGEKIEVHPTLDSFVKTIAPGQWEATGALFDGLMKRIALLGPHGFRALLWHQGESDAGQARAGYPAERQISGEQYRQLLARIIHASQEQAGWKFPWFVAQATYHSPTDSADAEFRQAQKKLWDDGIAEPGPDTDVLTSDFRTGVHFNGKGLQAHGRLWAEKVSPYLDRMFSAP